MSFKTHMEVVLCFIYMNLVKSLSRFFDLSCSRFREMRLSPAC